MISCCLGLPVQETDSRQGHEKPKGYEKVKAEVTVTGGTGCCHSKLCLPRVTQFDGGFAVSCVHKIRTGETGLALQQD